MPSEWARTRLRELDENFPTDPETESGRILRHFLSARGER